MPFHIGERLGKEVGSSDILRIVDKFLSASHILLEAASRSSSAGLPATWAEYQDAMQKARVTCDRVIYNVNLCDSKRL